MRGIPHFNFPAFFEAEAVLAAQGVEVFNPAARDQAAGLRWEDCHEGTMEELAAQDFDLADAYAHDIEYVIREAEVVILLPGWQASRGAVAEASVAAALDKALYAFDPITGTLSRITTQVMRQVTWQEKVADHVAVVGLWIAGRLHPSWRVAPGQTIREVLRG